ncbi:GTPase IMAP family member 2-like [Astyanax mexicanus]|uniref:GTPase IMAP family member 8 n=1 Tax=Astyanax mexicanus TaxID=7994 RepID=A0A8T2LV10_ASTMX|nr:GTPase IMAP family member 2-like [Astyanax mexicanus]
MDIKDCGAAASRSSADGGSVRFLNTAAAPEEDFISTLKMSKEGMKEPLKLVLLGSKETGKSATANTILGGDVFPSGVGMSDTTRSSCGKTGKVDGREVIVVDTPAMYKSGLNDTVLKEELKNALIFCDPGPHVFLFVVALGSFSEKHGEILKKVNKTLRSNVSSFSMVLFTNGEKLKAEDKIDHIIEKNQGLKELIESCGGRYKVFNNEDKENNQVKELLDQIDDEMKKRSPENMVFTSPITKEKITWVTKYCTLHTLALVGGSAVMMLSKSSALANVVEQLGLGDAVMAFDFDYVMQTVESVVGLF